MLNPHQISERLAVLAGVSLLAALIVPSAFAVEPMIEGGNDPGYNPAAMVEAPSSGFDWSAALAVALIGLAVLVTTLAVYHAATRRDRPLAAR